MKKLLALSVLCFATLSSPLEGQPLGDTLAGKEDAIGQKHTDIRSAAARGPAGVLQLELTREPSDYYQEVGVNNG